MITLGVIGVVAALTLPALMNKTQDKILETQYAKCKNVVVNGYKLMMSKYDMFKVENLPILNECNSMTEKACMSKEHKKTFNIASDSNGGLSPNVLPTDYIIQGETEKSPFKWDEVPYIFATADGMTYGVLPDENLVSFSVVADINGAKNPNTVKKDLYKFRFAGNGQIADVSGELGLTNTCSVKNLGACKTQEECQGLGTRTTTNYGSGYNDFFCVSSSYYVYWASWGSCVGGTNPDPWYGHDFCGAGTGGGRPGGSGGGSYY